MSTIAAIHIALLRFDFLGVRSHWLVRMMDWQEGKRWCCGVMGRDFATVLWTPRKSLAGWIVGIIHFEDPHWFEHRWREINLIAHENILKTEQDLAGAGQGFCCDGTRFESCFIPSPKSLSTGLMKTGVLTRNGFVIECNSFPATMTLRKLLFAKSIPNIGKFVFVGSLDFYHQ